MLDEAATSFLQGTVIAHLAVVDESGRPHVSPTWVHAQDGLVRINTREGRVKARLLQVGAPVALSATDPETPYRWLGVRGTVVGRTHDGADDEIIMLARKYWGRDYDRFTDQPRVSIAIEPTWVSLSDA